MGQKYYAASTGGFYDDDIHTSLPDDAVTITDKKWEDLLTGQSNGKAITADDTGKPVLTDPVAPARTDEEIQTNLTNAIQDMLDDEAKTRGYGGILSLCTYTDSTIEKFATEAAAGKLWRDKVWEMANVIMADVKSSARTVPTESELLAELPSMVWPA